MIMPDLNGQRRELVLFRVQDAIKVLTEIEELLCLDDEEDEAMFPSTDSTKE
jgi:hypothetical protein